MQVARSVISVQLPPLLQYSGWHWFTGRRPGGYCLTIGGFVLKIGVFGGRATPPFGATMINRFTNI